MTYELRQEGATLYVLNKNGTNAFTMHVQAGFYDNGERLSDDACEGVALVLLSALQLAIPQGTGVIFEPLVSGSMLDR